jgi:hypothetical protein
MIPSMQCKIRERKEGGKSARCKRAREKQGRRDAMQARPGRPECSVTKRKSREEELQQADGMGKEDAIGIDEKPPHARGGSLSRVLLLVHGKFCLTSLTYRENAMQCSAMHARVYGCFAGRLHRDRRLLCCGTGSRRVRGCWVLLGWVGPRGVYFVGLYRCVG